MCPSFTHGWVLKETRLRVTWAGVGRFTCTRTHICRHTHTHTQECGELMTEESSAFGHLNSRESTPSVHKRTCGEKVVVFTLSTKLSGCSVAVSSPTTGSLRHAHFFPSDCISLQVENSQPCERFSVRVPLNAAGLMHFLMHTFFMHVNRLV